MGIGLLQLARNVSYGKPIANPENEEGGLVFIGKKKGIWEGCDEQRVHYGSWESRV